MVFLFLCGLTLLFLQCDGLYNPSKISPASSAFIGKILLMADTISVGLLLLRCCFDLLPKVDLA
jgi:hypothetical protein